MLDHEDKIPLDNLQFGAHSQNTPINPAMFFQHKIETKFVKTKKKHKYFRSLIFKHEISSSTQFILNLIFCLTTHYHFYQKSNRITQFVEMVSFRFLLPVISLFNRIVYAFFDDLIDTTRYAIKHQL